MELARTFHPLLATGATLCPKYLTAFAALEDVRAKIKTARRFCFSPHERQGVGVRPPHRRQAPGKYRGSVFLFVHFVSGRNDVGVARAFQPVGFGTHVTSRAGKPVPLWLRQPRCEKCGLARKNHTFIVIANPRNEGVAIQLDGLLRRYTPRNDKRRVDRFQCVWRSPRSVIFPR